MGFAGSFTTDAWGEDTRLCCPHPRSKSDEETNESEVVARASRSFVYGSGGLMLSQTRELTLLRQPELGDVTSGAGLQRIVTGCLKVALLRSIC